MAQVSKFKPSDRIAIHKRGKRSQYGTVYRIGAGKVEGYYYIDLDGGDRLLFAEKELTAADPEDGAQAVADAEAQIKNYPETFWLD